MSIKREFRTHRLTGKRVPKVFHPNTPGKEIERSPLEKRIRERAGIDHLGHTEHEFLTRIIWSIDTFRKQGKSDEYIQRHLTEALKKYEVLEEILRK